MCKLDILKAYGLQVSKHVFVNVAHLTGRNVCTNGNEDTIVEYVQRCHAK